MSDGARFAKRATGARTPKQSRGSDAVTRGRPRDADADESILAAARELLANDGFEAMSFEAIAQMTGVTRPTIYRRWPSKAHLASEIAHGGDASIADVLDREGLRPQIKAFLEQLVSQYERPEMRAATAGLAVSYMRTPELRAELHDPLEKATRAKFAAIVEKALQCGLMRSGTEADTLFDTLVGAVIFRTIFSAVPMDRDSFIKAVCEIVLDGIAPR